jgi:hypothetical protein
MKNLIPGKLYKISSTYSNSYPVETLGLAMDSSDFNLQAFLDGKFQNCTNNIPMDSIVMYIETFTQVNDWFIYKVLFKDKIVLMFRTSYHEMLQMT